ncbi:MAG: hypothetical protein JWM53_2113 [bacterium]|nr:hypothetical protein [bacterium]
MDLMQSRVGLRLSRFAVGVGIVVLAAGFAGWGVRQHDLARVAPLRAAMTFDELAALYGKPLWTVGTNADLQYLASNLRFRSTPLVGHCMNPTAAGGRSLATANELPWILSPRTARQVWLFRTGRVSGILVYPDDAYRASCILYARPSGWFALLGN